MSDYEMTLLTKSEGDKEAVKELIAKLGGEVTDERSLGQKPLAYPIKKERVAYFTIVRFELAPEGVLAFNKELLLSGAVLRHMITTAEARAPVTAGIIERAVKSVRSTQKVSDRTGEKPAQVAVPEEVVEAKEAKPAKKTKAQKAVEEKQAKDRQKAIEAELEKILREE